MGKHCIAWWSLFYIPCFILLGNGGAGKGLTLAMKGHLYYKEEATIKTFKFDGDVVDCVDIYKQPAFDHPLLKNHTIQYAGVQVIADKLYGASANFDVYRPRLEDQREFSISQISIASQDFSTALEAGWMVYPSLYGDDKTRFFTFWTNNNYRTSCYNLRCPGFVWTNHAIRVDTKLKPYSIVGGLQHDVNIKIFQDGNHGSWWVSLDGNLLGYWLRSIVPKLGDGAHLHSFGGEILNKKKTGAHTSTQMGSGHFATEGQGKSASIKHVKVVEASDRSKYTVPDVYSTFVTHPTCYNVEVGHDLHLSWEFYFYYGGAGRSATCA